MLYATVTCMHSHSEYIKKFRCKPFGFQVEYMHFFFFFLRHCFWHPFWFHAFLGAEVHIAITWQLTS